MASLIFLAGGQGSRLGVNTPKQYLPLGDKKIFNHSFETFLKSSLIQEIVVVCAPLYRSLFPKEVLFAIPGDRRQDSVYAGLLKTTQDIILTHDAARPFIQEKYLPLLLEAIERTGAAALASPVTSTIKKCSADGIILQTLDRTTLWEMQTPQGMKRNLFFESFDYVNQHNLNVTDDLSMCECIGKNAEIVHSSPQNFKITTPFDLAVAKTLCATK